jgi:hypothetical protein
MPRARGTELPMSTDLTAAAESALLVARHRLAALGVPADDLPDDLVPVASGGSLMPALPGWTPARARDWAAVAARWPAVARRVVAWCDENAGRLANLEAIIAIPSPIHPSPPSRFIVRLLNIDAGRLQAGSNAWLDDHLFPEAAPSTEADLDNALARLNRIPRHAELAAAVAAARRGDRPATDFHLTDWTRSHDGTWPRPSTIIPVYPLEAVAIVRVVPSFLDDILGHTNAAPFCGAEPDELILQALDGDRIEDDSRSGPRIRLTYFFEFRPGHPWSRFPNPDGAWRILQDENGHRPFEPADFFELP